MKVRNKNENVYYIDFLDTAIDGVKEAIDSISYETCPDMNQNTITKLEEALRILWSARVAPIFKP